MEGGGVVTRIVVHRLEARIRHWENQLRDSIKVCKRPTPVACFRQGLRDLERVRVKIEGRCLEQPDDEEVQGEGLWNRLEVNPDSDVELQEVVGKSVLVLGDQGAVGGLGWMGLRYKVKKSPVGSYSFEGLANMETSRQGRLRNSTQVGQVKEELGRSGGIRRESCWNGTRGLVEGMTAVSEVIRLFDLVKIPNPFQAIVGAGRRLCVENEDSVI